MSIIKSGTVIFLASMAGNLSNYLFQFFMGKNLSVEDYGAMNAVIAMLVIVAIPTGTIMLVVAKYASAFSAKGEDGKLSLLYRNSLLRMCALGFVFMLPFMAFNSAIMDYLKIASGWPIVIAGVGLLSSFLITVNFGMLQGLKKFNMLGAGLGLGALVRLFSGVLLVFFGFGVNGAVAASVFQAAFIFALTFIPLSGFLKANKGGDLHTKEILLYSVPVLLSSIAFTLATNIDLIIVKHLFTPEDAGIYASVAVLGKIILYLPAALVLVLFPMVSESSELNRDSFKILDKGLIYTAVISVAGVAAFSIFPDFIVRLLFGEKYLAAASLIKYYSISMMFMGFMSIIISFNLARRKAGFIYSMAAACLALFIVINFFHASLLSVILEITAINFCLVGVNIWSIYRDRKAFYLVNEPQMEGAGG